MMYTLENPTTSTMIIPSSEFTADLVSLVGKTTMPDASSPTGHVFIIDVLMHKACDLLRDRAAAESQLAIKLSWVYNTFTAWDSSNIDHVNKMAIHWTAMVMGLKLFYETNGFYNYQGLTYWSYGSLQGYDMILTNIGG